MKKGTRVRLTARPEWGLGELVEDGSAVAIRVFFVNGGLRTLAPSVAKLEVVTGPAAENAWLDDLSAKALEKDARYLSIPHAIERFLEKFPKGFYDDGYANEERDYKVFASDLAKEHLGVGALAKKLKAEAYEEIGREAMRVVTATNLIFPNEIMALNDALKSSAGQIRFARGLGDLLAVEKPSEGAFRAFAAMLEEIAAAKWTIATYFPYLVYPDTHIFLKPMVTQAAAELSGFDLNYKPQLNWLTYSRLLEFANRLRKDLAKLKPRDMIDVQSFIWCIAQEG